MKVGLLVLQEGRKSQDGVVCATANIVVMPI